jgi:hypothetical protein
MAEAFNVFNRQNKRFTITEDGFQTQAGQFVPFSQRVGATYYPGQYRRAASLTGATGAYSPRQMQIALRLIS